MFGRRRREEREDSAREAERRALFDELAKRPESVCPFLGLASSRAGYRPEPNGEHRCYAFGDPAPLSDEQQRHVCLERGYSNCPRYLRGVLVIPTEELEALRRPQAAAPPPPPPPARAAQGGGGRRSWLVIPLLLVLIGAIAAGGWYLVNNPGALAFGPSTTPSASAQPSPQASLLPTPRSSASPGSSATPHGGTPTPLPTPTTGAVFVGYWVVVAPQGYQVFHVDGSGTIVDTLSTRFANYSHATVQRIVATNGLINWRCVDGLPGWSYVKDRSGPFQIYRIFRSPDGSTSGILVPPDQT